MTEFTRIFFHALLALAASATRLRGDGVEAAPIPVQDVSPLRALLTQSSFRATALKSWGTEESDDSAPGSADDANTASNFMAVCERTRAALFRERPAEVGGLLGGPVYSECAAALAPLTAGKGVVAVLSECTALADALVQEGYKGARGTQMCKKVMSELQATTTTMAALPPPQQAAVTVAPAAPPAAAAPRAPAAGETGNAKAMEEVCVETVQIVETGVNSWEAAMKLDNEVATICEDRAQARFHITDVAPMMDTVREWCYRLDGRLSLALEAGFFFALQPDEAQRQAGRTNPYAATTRREFCQRYARYVQKDQESAPMLPRQAVQEATKSAPRRPARQQPVPGAAAQPEQTQPAQAAVGAPTALPAAPAAPPAAPAAPAVAAVAETRPAAEPAASGAGQGALASPSLLLLRSLRGLSQESGWVNACQGLAAHLASREGSVTDEQVLRGQVASQSSEVLLFNVPDRSEIGRCAANLRALAGKRASVDVAPPSGPWAEEACSDLAHGFLTLKLERPGSEPVSFCNAYSAALQRIADGAPPRAPPAPADAAQAVPMPRPAAAQPQQVAVAQPQAAQPAAPLAVQAARPAAAMASPKRQVPRQAVAARSDVGRLRARATQERREELSHALEPSPHSRAAASPARQPAAAQPHMQRAAQAAPAAVRPGATFTPAAVPVMVEPAAPEPAVAPAAWRAPPLAQAQSAQQRQDLAMQQPVQPVVAAAPAQVEAAPPVWQATFTPGAPSPIVVAPMAAKMALPVVARTSVQKAPVAPPSQAVEPKVEAPAAIAVVSQPAVSVAALSPPAAAAAAAPRPAAAAPQQRVEAPKAASQTKASPAAPVAAAPVAARQPKPQAAAAVAPRPVAAPAAATDATVATQQRTAVQETGSAQAGAPAAGDAATDADTAQPQDPKAEEQEGEAFWNSDAQS